MNGRVSIIRNLLGFNFIPKRTCSDSPKGIEYYGFTYYPRHEDFKDPPYEPSKLFFIKRIKSMKGRNPTERVALERLNIDGEVYYNGHVSVVKNIPPINALLWKVKHLVEIRPIRVNGELPKDGDYSGTHLRHTGEFIVSPKLKVSEKDIEASEDHRKTSKKLKRQYIREYLRVRWLQGYSYN